MTQYRTCSKKRMVAAAPVGVRHKSAKDAVRVLVEIRNTLAPRPFCAVFLESEPESEIPAASRMSPVHGARFTAVEVRPVPGERNEAPHPFPL